jgi:hypothetical protein
MIEAILQGWEGVGKIVGYMFSTEDTKSISSLTYRPNSLPPECVSEILTPTEAMGAWHYETHYRGPEREEELKVAKEMEEAFSPPKGKTVKPWGLSSGSTVVPLIASTSWSSIDTLSFSTSTKDPIGSLYLEGTSLSFSSSTKPNPIRLFLMWAMLGVRWRDNEKIKNKKKQRLNNLSPKLYHEPTNAFSFP